MCDFVAGDKVVCVDGHGDPHIALGTVYTVKSIDPVVGKCTTCGDEGVGIELVESRFSEEFCHCPMAFRKVQRRDLTEWLSSSVGNTDKIDKRKRVNA